jgi:uncharacterized surface protein with fasciclin (FAS1) repeats
MRLNRLLSTAAAAALVACPALVLAQTAAAPAAPAATAPAAPAAAPAPPVAPLPPSPNVVPNGDWITTLRGSGHFTVLLKALDTNQLTAPLKAAPNLTVFAPTDEAFNALPPTTLQLLLSPAGAQQLRKVLTYHVVNLPMDSAKIKGTKTTVGTVEAQQVTLDGGGDVILVNNADVIQSDVKTANGVTVFVVDKVLIPADVTLPGVAASATPSAPTTGG